LRRTSRRRGHFDVKVEAHLETAKTHDSIIYHITKEKKHKVDEVKLSGNSYLHSDDLTPHIAIEENISLSREIQRSVSAQKRDNLKAVYQSEGFSDVAVVPTVARRDEDIDVTFRVTEGRAISLARSRSKAPTPFPLRNMPRMD